MPETGQSAAETVNPMLAWALHYASRGWRVIPVHTTISGRCSCGRDCGKNAGKHPRVRKPPAGWGSTDPDQIRRWWSRWPDGNIGLATGSGLVVVDIDGEHDEQELQQLREKHNWHIPTAWVRSGRAGGKGYHLYLAGDLAGSHKPGSILIRGEGGFVVAPPSLHQSGQRYQWVDDVPLAPMPAWLREYAETHVNNREFVLADGSALAEMPAFLLGVQGDKARAGANGARIAERAAANLRALWSATDQAEVESALSVLDPSCARKPWLDIGMALHSLNWERSDGSSIGFDLWDRWSSGSKDKYSEWDTATVWKSFAKGATGRAGGITIGTLFHLAQKAGWIRPRSNVGNQTEQEVMTHTEADTLRQHNATPQLASPPAGADFFGGAAGPGGAQQAASAGYLNGHAAALNGNAAAASVVPASVLSPQRPIRWIDRDDDGFPKITCANAGVAIQHLGITCRYDVFHEKMLLGGQPIQQWAGDLSDNAVQMVRHIIKQVYGFDPNERNVRDAAVQLSLKQQFNPVVEYLGGLQWDGTPRLQQLLPRYFGADASALNQEIGRLMLMAAVRRARQPGAKFDQITVLEGPEGTGKSAAIQLLAGRENFSDQRILSASDKEQQEAVCGVWLYELAELEGIRRTDVERIKQFASRTIDRARPAYGRFRVDRPRTCVFVATTNEQDYLKGTTGNRRFWPVRTNRIELDALARDRDQLWAEAAHYEAEGIAIGLDQRLWAIAAEEAHGRLEEDAWMGWIRDYLAALKEPWTTVADVLTRSKIMLHIREVNQMSQSRAARCLVKLKWERYQQRIDASHREWRYRPKG